jgi:hypothetical protein
MRGRIRRREFSRHLRNRNEGNSSRFGAGFGRLSVRRFVGSLSRDSFGFSSNIQMNKADKCYIFLTLDAHEPIVRGVILSFRQFIASVLVVLLIAASVPCFVCAPAACAAIVDCKYMHCACCGPNCPWQKSSQKSPKHGNCCNEQCPVIAASKTVIISNEQPLAAAMSGFGEAQPFLFGYTFSGPPLVVHQSANLHPPTLLSLACALTI